MANRTVESGNLTSPNRPFATAPYISDAAAPTFNKKKIREKKVVGRRANREGWAPPTTTTTTTAKKVAKSPRKKKKRSTVNGQQSTRRGMAWKRRLCRPITNGAHNTAHTPRHQRSQHSHKEEKATRQPHDVSYAQQPP